MTGGGVVFDIRRFSVHDGEGIRTTVFLKGCPLRCLWCQNPEGIDPLPEPVWLSGACIRCGGCVKKALSLGVEFDPEKVRAVKAGHETWNAIMDVCPARALLWDGRIMTVEEVMAEVEKDRVFFSHGGGFTLSGGEPLAQGEFALALLEKGRETGIHTAIETSLFAPKEIVDAAAERAGHIFADCKIFDEQKHIEGTGQSNTIILENLRRLLSGKYARKVTVRTPLIPGWTGGCANIAAIANFMYKETAAGSMENGGYELLNYNPLAAAKYPRGNRYWTLPEDLKPYSAEQMEAYRSIAAEKGVVCTG
jgi:pyruvate formate lyase activating enzyme